MGIFGLFSHTFYCFLLRAAMPRRKTSLEISTKTRGVSMSAKEMRYCRQVRNVKEKKA